MVIEVNNVNGLLLCTFHLVRLCLYEIRNMLKLRRRRGRGKTKDPKGKTMAQHVRFKNFIHCIAVLLKKLREFAKICVH